MLIIMQYLRAESQVEQVLQQADAKRLHRFYAAKSNLIWLRFELSLRLPHNWIMSIHVIHCTGHERWFVTSDFVYAYVWKASWCVMVRQDE
jgi:hypothetical protein